MSFNVEDDNNDTYDEEGGFQADKDIPFSKQVLVMSAMRKCLEAGSREMRSGYFNEKSDKNGNIIRTYIEDTRKAFIESVETLEMIACADLKDVQAEIDQAKADLMNEYDNLCNAELKDWTTANIKVKQARWNQGIVYREHYLSTSLPYYQEYMSEEVKTARKIFKIIMKTISTSNDYLGEGEISG